MCHIATRSERNFACGKIFPCVHAEGMGECVTANSVDIAHCYPPQTGDNKRENDIRSPQSRHGCPLTRTCRINATKSPLGLFKEISPKRNFFQGEPQSDCNRREGPSLSVSLRDTEIHSSCALRTQRKFRALRSASRGSAPTPRKPSRRLDPSFISRCASKCYVNITQIM